MNRAGYRIDLPRRGPARARPGRDPLGTNPPRIAEAKFLLRLPPVRAVEASVFRVTSELDAIEARGTALAMARRHSFTAARAHGLATAVSELASNLVFHAARGGLLHLRVVKAAGIVLIECSAEDDGPGIGDLPLAMSDGFSSNGGLGYGLPGCRRLTDDFAITSTPGLGTRVICAMAAP